MLYVCVYVAWNVVSIDSYTGVQDILVTVYKYQSKQNNEETFSFQTISGYIKLVSYFVCNT